MISIKTVSKWYGTFQVLTDNTTEDTIARNCEVVRRG